MKTGIGRVSLLLFLVLGIWGSTGAAAVTPENPTGFSYGQPSSHGGFERDGVEHLNTDSMQANPASCEKANTHGTPSPENAVSKDCGGKSIKIDAVIGVLASVATLIALISMMT